MILDPQSQRLAQLFTMPRRQRPGMPQELRLPQQQPAMAPPPPPQPAQPQQAAPQARMSPEELSRVLGSGAAAIGQFANQGIGNTGAAIAALAGGVGQGRQQFAQEQTEREMMDFQRQQIERQAQMQQAEAAREAQRQAEIEQIVAGMPPEFQRLARLDPKAFSERLIDRQMPEQQEPDLQVKTFIDGGVERQVLMDMNTGDPVRELGAGPRFAPQREVESGSTTAARTRALKIEDAMRQFNIDQPRATALVDGYINISTDPVTGNTMLVDRVTGQGRPVDEPQMEATDYGDLESPPLYSLADRATGFMSAAEEVGSGITGQLGGPVAKETIAARQSIRNAQNDLIRALSINPRFPVGEIERIQKETNIAPSVLDSPGSLRARMESIDAYLSDRLKKEQAAANNRQLPRETRQAASAAAIDIAFFLEQLGVPDEPKSSGPAPGTRIRYDAQGNRIQ